MLPVRSLVAGLLLMLAAACGGEAPVANAAVDVGDLNAVATAAPTVAEVLAQGNDSVAPPSEPAPVPFDHHGRWAATEALCTGGAWRFVADGVSTDGETSCRVTGTQPISPTSKKLTMRCTAEGIETIESWALNLHPDGTMGVSRSEGGNSVPRTVTLRRCAAA